MQANMGTPIYNPIIPTVIPIAGGFLAGRMIRVQGQANPRAERFAINLQCGPRTDPRDDIALHLNFRFVEQCIVRNNLVSQNWGQEEIGGGMPIHPGQNFEALILCQHDCIKVAINGNHFCEFFHRVPYQKISHITIDGDVDIQLIGFEGPSGGLPQQQNYAPQQPGAYGPQPGNFGPPPPAYGAPPAAYGAPPAAYGYQQGGYPPPGAGYPPPAAGYPPPGAGFPPPGYPVAQQPQMMGPPMMQRQGRGGPGIGTALAAGAAGGLMGGLAGGVLGNMIGQGSQNNYVETAPPFESSGLNIMTPSEPQDGQELQNPPPPTTQSDDFLQNTERAAEQPNPEPPQDADDDYLENNEPEPEPQPAEDGDDDYIVNDDPATADQPAADNDDDYLDNDDAAEPDPPAEADDGGDFGGDDWAE